VSSPVLARSTTNGRVYEHPLTGEQVPSVTTIISGGVPKPALPRWAAKAAAEYACKQWPVLCELDEAERLALIKGAPWRESEKAATLGSEVHDAVDAWCTGRSMPAWAEGVAPFMEQFVEFLEQRSPEFVENECTVWNRTHGYAGTLDFLAVIGGRLTLADTKTGKGVYPEVALQLTALARAEFILRPDGREEPLPAAELLGVLHLRPKSWALIPVTPGEQSWRAFLAAADITRWSRETSPTVLGPRLRPGAS
jgi:hypothetical protein